MLYNVLKLLHVLSVIVWVGGMVFAHFFLRPAAQQLPPAQRVPLMHAVLRRFLAAVGAAVVIILTTGLALIGMASAGGGFSMPWDWSFMAVVGIVMMAIYTYIYRALLSRLNAAVAAADWPVAASALARIRTAVLANLALGSAIIVVVLLW